MTGLQVNNLHCEYQVNPIGLDVGIPRLSWQLINEKRGTFQRAYQVQVALDDGFNELVWDSGKVMSDQSVHVEYGGPALQSRTRYYYRVRAWDNHGGKSPWSSTAFWEMGILQQGEWLAQWITPCIEEDKSKSSPCPYLRRDFPLKHEEIVKAVVYVTACGLYELYINGQRVGEDLFTPGWTAYHKRLQYQTYEVTELVQQGANTLGAILGDGWFRGNLVWKDRRNTYGDTLGLFLQLHVQFADGTEQIVTSDDQWKVHTGPILASDIYNGEVYDARLEHGNWHSPGFEDAHWHKVAVFSPPIGELVAQAGPPVRKISTITPVEVLITPDGDTVVDMGQNMVGWVRLSAAGEKGARVILHHAEVLDARGCFYTENLRSAKQRIEYILRGGSCETFEPHFTFQGFRYVKVAGDAAVDLDSIVGVVIHSDLAKTGSFDCSHELVNKLQENIRWGQKGNFLDVPTDCPQRDERLGWTGDAQVFIRTACFNMQVAGFFAKWLGDLRAEQRTDGAVPKVIPDVLQDTQSSSAWGDAATICPWTIYECYGDRRILEQQYASMKAWVEYIRREGDNPYLWNTGFHYGDWLALDAEENSYTGATPKELIATACYANSVRLLKDTAKILGKEQDAQQYAELHRRIVEAFRQEFVTPNGELTAATQTAHVLALMFDLVEDKQITAQSLVELVKQANYHLTTGFVGTPYLCFALSDNGYASVAYTLLLQEDYPSWLYPITKGATTMWEHWDGIKPDGSFWSKDMNSFNHYAFGSIGEWLYRRVCGLDTDPSNPGYKRFKVAPHIHPSLTYARLNYRSLYGLIRVGWVREEKRVKLAVTVPTNTRSVVVLVGARAAECLERGQPLHEVPGILSIRETEHGIEVEVGSGEYLFAYSTE